MDSKAGQPIAPVVLSIWTRPIHPPSSSGLKWEFEVGVGRDRERRKCGNLKGGEEMPDFTGDTSNFSFLPMLSGAGSVRWFNSLVSRGFFILGTNGPTGHCAAWNLFGRFQTADARE